MRSTKYAVHMCKMMTAEQKKLGLIVNPVAGQARGLRLGQQLRKSLEVQGVVCSVRVTSNQGDARRWAESAASLQHWLALVDIADPQRRQTSSQGDSRDHVVLPAERGDEEAVDRVGRGQDQDRRFVHRTRRHSWRYFRLDRVD